MALKQGTGIMLPNERIHYEQILSPSWNYRGGRSALDVAYTEQVLFVDEAREILGLMPQKRISWLPAGSQKAQVLHCFHGGKRDIMNIWKAGLHVVRDFKDICHTLGVVDTRQWLIDMEIDTMRERNRHEALNFPKSNAGLAEIYNHPYTHHLITNSKRANLQGLHNASNDAILTLTNVLAILCDDRIRISGFPTGELSGLGKRRDFSTPNLWPPDGKVPYSVPAGTIILSWDCEFSKMEVVQIGVAILIMDHCQEPYGDNFRDCHGYIQYLNASVTTKMKNGERVPYSTKLPWQYFTGVSETFDTASEMGTWLCGKIRTILADPSVLNRVTPPPHPVIKSDNVCSRSLDDSSLGSDSKSDSYSRKKQQQQQQKKKNKQQSAGPAGPAKAPRTQPPFRPQPADPPKASTTADSYSTSTRNIAQEATAVPSSTNILDNTAGFMEAVLTKTPSKYGGHTWAQLAASSDPSSLAPFRLSSASAAANPVASQPAKSTTTGAPGPVRPQPPAPTAPSHPELGNASTSTSNHASTIDRAFVSGEELRDIELHKERTGMEVPQTVVFERDGITPKRQVSRPGPAYVYDLLVLESAPAANTVSLGQCLGEVISVISCPLTGLLQETLKLLTTFWYGADCGEEPAFYGRVNWDEAQLKQMGVDLSHFQVAVPEGFPYDCYPRNISDLNLITASPSSVRDEPSLSVAVAKLSETIAALSLCDASTGAQEVPPQAGFTTPAAVQMSPAGSAGPPYVPLASTGNAESSTTYFSAKVAVVPNKTPLENTVARTGADIHSRSDGSVNVFNTQSPPTIAPYLHGPAGPLHGDLVSDTQSLPSVALRLDPELDTSATNSASHLLRYDYNHTNEDVHLDGSGSVENTDSTGPAGPPAVTSALATIDAVSTTEYRELLSSVCKHSLSEGRYKCQHYDCRRKPRLCPDFTKAECTSIGAHTHKLIFHIWEQCDARIGEACHNHNCQISRDVYHIYPTCKKFIRDGDCPSGVSCSWGHDEVELRRRIFTTKVGNGRRRRDRI